MRFATSPEPVTEITNDPQQPIRVRHHPRWCGLQRCITGDGGARHTSATTGLPTGEQTFTLTLVQHDPHGAPELLIEVTDTADPNGLHLLTLYEIKALAETLLIEYLKPRAPGRRDHPDPPYRAASSSSRHRP